MEVIWVRNIVTDTTLSRSIVSSIKYLDRVNPDWREGWVCETKKYRVEYLGTYSGTSNYYVEDKATGEKYLAEWYHSRIENPRYHGWTVIKREVK
jgi:hypothetical protein